MIVSYEGLLNENDPKFFLYVIPGFFLETQHYLQRLQKITKTKGTNDPIANPIKMYTPCFFVK